MPFSVRRPANIEQRCGTPQRALGIERAGQHQRLRPRQPRTGLIDVRNTHHRSTRTP
jgi:hypothetical protein